MRAIDAAARKIPEDRLLEVRLEGLLVEEKRKAGKQVVEFAGVSMGKRVRKFLRIRMSSDEANEERWRRGLSDSKAADIDRRYAEILDRLEADGVSSVPLLRGSTDGG
jgi:hypothetical protein